ncbi:MAG: penicillin acylase family protein, partial [Chloroflexota bacterium]|nr:penicillin acylase family protein [Chloroflexota bacterium]
MSTPNITRSDLSDSLPDVTSSFRLRGPEGLVEVYRDGYGIPHVRAQGLHDAFFAQGFVTAQDRLWHMEYDRRRACGRWAEFAGAEAVEQDVLARRVRLAATSRADYRAASPEAKAMLDAYAAGVNAFLRSTKRLPIEYRIVGAEPEPWLPWHSLAVFKVRHALMGVFEMKLWRAMLLRRLGPERAAALFPGYEEGQLLILPPGATFRGPEAAPVEDFAHMADALRGLGAGEGGSNNWVLSGSRTASGKPLVAGDPHRSLDTPNVYYQNHVACPDFDVAGMSFPGVPGFPHFGHNQNVAWAVTHAMADYQDLFIERFKQGAPHLYLFRGRWHRAKVYHEVVKARGLPDVPFDVTVTHHGPVIAGEPSQGYGIAFRYTATSEPCTFAEALLPQLRATSADELEEAMRPWVDPCNNFVFADTSGNIGYRTRGKVPVRSMANAWLPVPGWTGEHEWQGYIPFEEMPRSRNPE